jgi:glycosyltransferase involved in cell wall biosynthesis
MGALAFFAQLTRGAFANGARPFSSPIISGHYAQSLAFAKRKAARHPNLHAVDVPRSDPEKPLLFSPTGLHARMSGFRGVVPGPNCGARRCARERAEARPLRVSLLARALGVGGTERQLVELATGLMPRGHDVTITTFYPENVYRDRLERSGVRVLAMDKSSRWHVASFLGRLARSIRELQPEIIYSFLPVPNVLAALLRPVLPRHGLIWSIRASGLQANRYDTLSRIALRLEPWLARIPDLAISNSEAGQRHALKQGFPADRLAVVPNGIDVERFRPTDRDGRAAARVALGLPAEAITVGMVARLDPMKDHDGFLRAIAGVTAHKDIRAVIAGAEPGPRTDRLQTVAESLGIAARVLWVGPVADIRQVYAALDVLCVASNYGEGFPNVLGEAMACGVPCVATDVGDTVEILGGLGAIAPRGNPSALTAALLSVIDRTRQDGTLLAKLRARVVERYGLDPMVDATERLLFNVRARTAG